LPSKISRAFFPLDPLSTCPVYDSFYFIMLSAKCSFDSFIFAN